VYRAAALTWNLSLIITSSVRTYAGKCIAKSLFIYLYIRTYNIKLNTFNYTYTQNTLPHLVTYNTVQCNHSSAKSNADRCAAVLYTNVSPKTLLTHVPYCRVSVKSNADHHTDDDYTCTQNTLSHSLTYSAIKCSHFGMESNVDHHTTVT